jgi:hypothetical protein
LICEYNQNTNFFEVDSVEIDDNWVDILNVHMRLNGNIRYTFIYNSKKESCSVVDKVIDKESELIINHK